MLRNILYWTSALAFACVLVVAGCSDSSKSVNSNPVVSNDDASIHDPPVLTLVEGEDIPKEYFQYMKEYEESAYEDSSRSKVPMNPTATSLGAWTSIAWPFGWVENPTLWRGDEGDRTSGGAIYSCGANINSHSGADYYARDLSRIDGSSDNKPIYAGRSGWVVKSGSDGGYGNVVVIWDPANHVCIRYAHLKSVNVYWGQYITIRQFIGRVGNTPGGFSSHLHLVVYENVSINSSGFPNVPNLCSGGTWNACRVYFFC